jgi:hypothetical protein
MAAMISVASSSPGPPNDGDKMDWRTSLASARQDFENLSTQYPNLRHLLTSTSAADHITASTGKDKGTTPIGRIVNNERKGRTSISSRHGHGEGREGGGWVGNFYFDNGRDRSGTQSDGGKYQQQELSDLNRSVRAFAKTAADAWAAVEMMPVSMRKDILGNLADFLYSGIDVPFIHGVDSSVSIDAARWVAAVHTIAWRVQQDSPLHIKRQRLGKSDSFISVQAGCMFTASTYAINFLLQQAPPPLQQNSATPGYTKAVTKSIARKLMKMEPHQFRNWLTEYPQKWAAAGRFTDPEKCKSIKLDKDELSPIEIIYFSSLIPSESNPK